MCSPQKKLVRRDLLKELATADASLRVIKGIIIIMFENELQTHDIVYNTNACYDQTFVFTHTKILFML